MELLFVEEAVVKNKWLILTIASLAVVIILILFLISTFMLSGMGIIPLYSFYYVIYEVVLVIGLDTLRFYLILAAIVTTILIVIFKIKKSVKC